MRTGSDWAWGNTLGKADPGAPWRYRAEEALRQTAEGPCPTGILFHEEDPKAGGGEKDYSKDATQFGDPDSHEGDAD